MLLDRLFTDPGRRCYQAVCMALWPDSNSADGIKFRPRFDDAFARQRESLDRLLPSLRRLLYYFFSRLTVQEPTFSEVAVVYSEIIPDEPPQLRLKSFRDIPIADVEVVFPGLQVDRMKTADIVKLV